MGAPGYLWRLLTAALATRFYGSSRSPSITRSELWLERSAAFGDKTVEWKTGFQAIKTDGPDFRVIHVAPDTPAAAAGLSVGDVITEIDGRPAASIGQAQLGELMRRRDGTVVRMTLLREGNPLRLTLSLKELLP
jgi:C-terminal processing protease CtpA/Prc